MKIASYLCKALTCLLLLASVNALKATEEFSLIRAGSFTMGNGVAEDTDIKDAPARTVTLDAFYIGKCEVTRAEWDDVRNWGLKKGYVDLPIGGESTNAPRNPSNYPAYYISWYAAVKWCNARSEKEGLTPVYYTDNGKTTVYKEGDVNVTNLQVKWTANGYRLPTEAEWEKAARGKLSGMRFPRGDTISHDEANYSASNIIYDITGVKVNDKPIVEGPPKKYTTPPPSAEMPNPKPYPEPHTSPISSFPPNAYELYDMAGNVYEWCWDWYGLYDGLPGLNPRGPELNESSKNERVYRGGAYADTAKQCRVANREQTSPSYKTSKLIGFRVARTAIGINGIVKYQDKPLEGIAVTAHRYDPNGDSSDSLDSATTDEFGKYSLVGLDPGAYRIRFDPGADNPILSNLAPQYYNNAPSLGLAQDVVLTSLKSVSGIDAMLAEASKITGKITSALDEAPIEKVMVRAYRKRGDNNEWDRSSWVNSALTKSDGAYELNLPEGTYMLEFFTDDDKYETKNLETSGPISRSPPAIINQSLRLNQAIDAFAPIVDKVYGDPDFMVIAPTATSRLPVALSVKSGFAVAEISGSTVTITGVGEVVLAAKQAGDANYLAAAEKTTSFTVSKGTPSITTKPVASAITFGQKLSSATLTGGIGSVAGTFAFSNPNLAPKLGKSTQTVLFSPTNANFNTVSFTIEINVVEQKEQKPAITSHPRSQTIADGGRLSLSVQATGGRLRYQWTKNGKNITGANLSTFTIAAASASDAGDYRVIVSNSKGSVTSNAARITILAPEIDVQQSAGKSLVSNTLKISFGTATTKKTSAGIRRTFTIRNKGTIKLTGISFSKRGAHQNDFTITQSNLREVAPGASATFTVTFKPAAVGQRAASLRIASNDRDENPFIINFTGQGAR